MRFDDDEGSPLPELFVVVVAGAGVVIERSAVPVPRLRICCWGSLRAPGVCGQFGTDWGSPEEEDGEEDEFGEEEDDGDEELAAATATATPTTANRRRRCCC